LVEVEYYDSACTVQLQKVNVHHKYMGV